MAIGLNELEPNVEHQLKRSECKPLEGISEVLLNASRDDWPVAQQTFGGCVCLQHRGSK
jgi:hypothetical protein